MRWDRLFDDLEGQLAQEQRGELEAEIADRTRRERAMVHVLDRLAASQGEIAVVLRGERRLAGMVSDVGRDFLIVAERVRHLVPLAAVLEVIGLTDRAVGPGAAAALRRFGLGYALRGLARDRAVVVLSDVTGRALSGRIGVVGADYLELTPGERGQQRGVDRPSARVIPFAAVACVTGTDPGHAFSC